MSDIGITLGPPPTHTILIDQGLGTSSSLELRTATGYLNTNKSSVSITGSNPYVTADFTGAGTVSIRHDGTRILVSGVSSASSDSASNLGAGSGVFAQKSAGDFQFKTLRAGPNITLTGTATELYISGSAGGGGGDVVYADLVSASGALSTRLGETGSNLLGQIQSNDAELALLNTASGHLHTETHNLISATGFLATGVADLKIATGVLSSVSGALSSRLGDTGSNLLGQITLLNTATGHLHAETHDLASATGYLDTQVNFLKTATGTLSSVSGALDARLVATGNNLQAQIGLLNTASGHLHTETHDLASATGYLNANKSEVSVTGSSKILSPNLTGVGTVTVTLGSNGSIVNISGVASASTDTASNLGAGSGVFAQKSAGDFQFKSLRAGPNIAITGTTTELFISGSAGGGGDIVFADLVATSGVLSDRIVATGNDLLGKINLLNTASGHLHAETHDLASATGYLNTQVNFLKTATGTLSSVSGALDARLVATGNNLQGQINLLNTATGHLHTETHDLASATGYLNANKSALSVTGSNIILLPNLTGLGTVTVSRSGDSWVFISGLAGASSDTASNLGGGSGIFAQKSAGDFQFKSLRAGPNITITGTTTELFISGSAGGAGASETAVNLGAGSGILSGKVGDEFKFKSLRAGPNLSITGTATELFVSGPTQFLALVLDGNGSPLATGLRSNMVRVPSTGQITSWRLFSHSGTARTTGLSAIGTNTLEVQKSSYNSPYVPTALTSITLTSGNSKSESTSLSIAISPGDVIFTTLSGVDGQVNLLDISLEILY